SIYVQKEALYKIKNTLAFFKQVKVKSDLTLYSHYPSCAMCSDSEKLLISKLEYAKWIKKFLKIKRPLFYKPDSYAFLYQLKEQEIQEIQPDQWHNKGEKIYRLDENIIYWPKDRHWELIKNIPDSIVPTIHDPITRCQKLYLNGGGGSGKTTRAIRIFKDINMIIFTYTNALAKDFQEKYNNGVGEWTPKHMREEKFSQVVI
ncbi:3479_t:CDS:2, partial [Gigaspora margarita]